MKTLTLSTQEKINLKRIEIANNKKDAEKGGIIFFACLIGFVSTVSFV